MSKFIDLTGKRFGRLLVVGRNIQYQKDHCTYHPCWDCICDCGNRCVVSGPSLRTGSTRSCGCYQKEIKHLNNKKFNSYYFNKDGYVIGRTSKGELFKIDADDYLIVKDYCWCINSSGYLVAWDSSTKKLKYLHRLIMGPNFGLVIDHMNGDKLDNRKKNLRICTQRENSMNCRLSINNTTGITGVRYYPNVKKWGAYIFVDGEQINLGSYQTKEEAVAERKIAEEKYFGKFSYDNSRKSVDI